jgi:general L-amino acid transport system substrate-binding protein
MTFRQVALLLPLLSATVCCAASSPTLDSIRRANALTCGIDQSEAEYSTTDEHGSRVAFDRDLCRAIAVAILGPHAVVTVKGYPDENTAVQALQHKEVDLVATVSDDFSQGTISGVGLVGPVLFDRQGLMVSRASGVQTVDHLAGRKICFLDQSEAELQLHHWFAKQKISFIPFPFQEEGEMEAAFVTNNCTAISGDVTRLANARATFGSRANDYVILPATIALDPLATAYRSEDADFGSVIRWTFNVLVAGEELGVGSANLDRMLSLNDPATRRLLGGTHELARPLSLREGWTADVLRVVGNYGEIFTRDLGPQSPMKLERAENSLWTSGGLLYALPLK